MMDNKIQHWEALIREAKGDVVRDELRRLRLQDVARRNRAELAKIARRVGLPSMALRLLFPFVRENKKAPPNPTASEKLEYAMSLVKVGIPEEATTIFESIDAKAHPLAELYHAFALIPLWETEKVIQLLSSFIERADSEYLRDVARVNLGAAYSFEGQFEKGQEVLLAAQKNPSSYVKSNAQRQLAMISIFMNRWEDAQKWLDESAELLAGANELHSFFVEMWRSILSFWKSGKGSLLEVRKKALNLRHWESVRNIDRFTARILNDERLFTHVYIGTRWPHYRQKLREDFPATTIPQTYSWKLGSGKHDLIVDVKEGAFRFRKETYALEEGQTLHRVLQSLTADFYKPMCIETFHRALYPDEFFNPLSSPKKVTMALFRFRRWLEDQELPLKIEEKNHWYSLGSQVGAELLVPKDQTPKEAHHLRLVKIKSHFSQNLFSVEEASKVLDLSIASVQRILVRGIDEGIVTKSQRTNKARYRFVA